MPEMPEVEIIKRDLMGRLKSRQITNVEIFLPRLVKWPSVTAFQAMIIGRTVLDLTRRGKYLLIHLDNKNQIVVHLRMTGRLCYVEASAQRDPYARILFYLDNGDLLVYADTRTLGTLYALGEDDFWRISGLAHMGPEPLSVEFTVAYLKEMLSPCRSKIKSFLLNQKYIGGLGNIYVDESLHIAGIHPERAGSTLSFPEVERLHAAINCVIANGINDGGTTFRDYRNGLGGKGSHQDRLLVYGKKGEPCIGCATKIERIEVGGRGTHFCPVCQR